MNFIYVNRHRHQPLKKKEHKDWLPNVIHKGIETGADTPVTFLIQWYFTNMPCNIVTLCIILHNFTRPVLWVLGCVQCNVEQSGDVGNSKLHTNHE